MEHESILATPQQVAPVLHTTPEALAQKRYLGTGPKFVKLGRRVYYRWADIYEWIDQNTMTRTDDRPGAA